MSNRLTDAASQRSMPPSISPSISPATSDSTPNPRDRRRGVSMLEMMIAMVILGIGILGTTAGQIAAIRLSSDSRINSEAMYLAEQQMELFKIMPAADVLLMAGTTNDPTNPIDPDPADNTTMALNRSWTVTDAVPEAGMIQIQVDVTWTNSLGVVRTSSVESYKVNL